MTTLSLIIIMSFLLISTTSFANDSNLENFTYPSHTCGEKIKKPKKPSPLKSQQDIEEYNNTIIDYNLEVSDYNKTIKNYKACINQYIQNGNHDINIIRKELNNALKEARKNKQKY